MIVDVACGFISSYFAGCCDAALPLEMLAASRLLITFGLRVSQLGGEDGLLDRLSGSASSDRQIIIIRSDEQFDLWHVSIVRQQKDVHPKMTGYKLKSDATAPWWMC